MDNMEKDFSKDYNPNDYKEDKRFRIALKEAKITQLFYFVPTILTIILAYALSPELGEPAVLFMGYPAWVTVTRILWIIVFISMLIYLKFGVKTVSFDARIEKDQEVD